MSAVFEYTSQCANRFVAEGTEVEIKKLSDLLIKPSDRGGFRMDFNALVPMPFLASLGAPSKWSDQFWGTPSNAEALMIFNLSETQIDVRFLTALRPPVEIYQHILTLFPAISFRAYYADSALCFLGCYEKIENELVDNVVFDLEGGFESLDENTADEASVFLKRYFEF